MSASCHFIVIERFFQDFMKNVKKGLVFISFITTIKMSMQPESFLKQLSTPVTSAPLVVMSVFLKI
jgi:hypothetical protein